MEQENSMETGTFRPHQTKGSGGRAAVGVGVLGLALAGVVISGTLPRMQHHDELSAAAQAQEVRQTTPEVTTVTPTTVTGSNLLLPGNIQAVEETVIYARTSGYLRKRYVDIGSKVRAGQILADIESPEVDQQLHQAQAETLKSQAGTGQAIADTARLQASVAQSVSETSRLRASVEKARSEKIRAEAKLAETRAASSNAKALLALAKQNLEGKRADLLQAQAHLTIAAKSQQRWQKLAQEGAVSQQEADERLATYDANKASVQSYASAILSAEAEVEAAQQNVNVSGAQIAAAQADIRTSEQDIQAAQSAVTSSEASIQAARESVNAGRQNIAAAQAGTLSNQANVQRVAVMKSFEQITAPFAGVITTRNVDNGALINAGNTGPSSGTTSSGLFGLARIDTLRIRINVPQASFLAIYPGQTAKVLVQELPSKEFVGQVARIAGAMDPATRTVAVEVRLPNKDGVLIPGMYAQVRFDLPQVTSVQLPTAALLSGTDGTRIALVTAENKVHFVPVKVGRDFGATIEIPAGLTGHEQVILNPSDSLKEGTTVHPTAAPGPAQKP